MKKAGSIGRATSDLSPITWRKLIDEIPHLVREDCSTPDPTNLLHAFLVKRDERIGEFEWSEPGSEIVVRGEIADVQGISEQIATRLGGKFMPD